MKKNTSYILLMTIISWTSLIFIDKKSFKRFIPGALFITLYLLVEGIIAEKKKWWTFHYKVKPNFLGELPLIIGPFFAGSLWILKYTFKNFKLYLLINLIIDSIFTYLLTEWIKKIGYVSLERLTKAQLSIIFMIKQISMYGFQFFYEKLMNKNYF